jgi:hypothetical protein
VTSFLKTTLPSLIVCVADVMVDRDGNLSSLLNMADKPLWLSFESDSLRHDMLSDTSAISLQFPGRLPFVDKKFQYMDIWEPHGTPPLALRCSIWGSLNSCETTWTSIALLPNWSIAKALKRGLHLLGKQQNAVVHWVDILRYIFMIGINDARLSLRDAMKRFEELVHTATTFTGTDSR